MVYSSKYVVCVLVNGQVQKELANGEVRVPFGTEYAVRLRNKHDRRAVATISIDGENVSGGGYVVPANGHIDIMRHSGRDAAFQFVDLESPEAVDAGKNGPNDDKRKGVISVDFRLEKKPAPAREVFYHHFYPRRPRPCPPPGYPWFSAEPYYGTGICHEDFAVKGMCAQASFNCSNSGLNSEVKTCGGILRSAPSPDLADGCTVEGGYTGQSFVSMSVDCELEVTCLRLFLRGYRSAAPAQVNQPTVSTSERYCDKCGSGRKRAARFCFHCGTKL